MSFSTISAGRADLPWRSCVPVLPVFFWQIFEFVVFLMVSIRSSLVLSCILVLFIRSAYYFSHPICFSLRFSWFLVDSLVNFFPPILLSLGWVCCNKSIDHRSEARILYVRLIFRVITLVCREGDDFFSAC